ncbi:helix-turn-helix domain-containing protein [Cohnella sp.]|uniref:helix-turn-helix domain-containing protein n=1 Tax=Cohnella sp. TaxID=1883426 RepID=UPI00356B55BE
MSDLGALLRKAREQCGYTLEDVQEYTKIRKRYLEAIETGDYKVLPGSFYVRAFVKTYAETVGLDAEEVLRLYHKELPQPATAETVRTEPRMKPARRSLQHNDRLGKVAVSLLMWAFPILIVVVIYIYLSNNGSDSKELDPSTPISTETASESPSVIAPPSESVTPPVIETPTPSNTASLTLKETRNSINYYEITPGQGHQLRLEVTDKCWIEVRANSRSGEKLYYKNVNEAQTLTFDMSTPIYVNVGRSDFVTIYVDEAMIDDGNKPGSTKYLLTPLMETAAAQ